jgi:D-alanyl-lipoteichoic acid acyltransferase DltB (MBOAT superfamily)
LLALSTVIDFSIGRRLGQTTDPRARRRLVTLSLASNLGILGFFKYAGFFSSSLQDLVGLFGGTLPTFALDVVLPVGISFYTFQTLSYTLDVYRRRLEPTNGLLDFALFVAFFPQLVAGPIERARHLLPQIIRPRERSLESFNSGGWLMLWGLFKKVVIADNLGVVVDAVYRVGAEPTAAEIVVATWAFAYQIYCDFSGYTDIARGTARLLGFDIMLNFRLPYAATNPAIFWRRWHISLSTWLRDYLYISMGGNREGRARTHRNLFLTMLIGGVWHGAAWPFVFWGAYHGLLLIAHRALAPMLARLRPGGRVGLRLYDALCAFVVFQLVCLGWLLFRAESLGHVGQLLRTLAGPFALGEAGDWLPPLVCLTAPLIVMQMFQARAGDQEVVLRWPLPMRILVYSLIMMLIVIFGEVHGKPFVYFQF